MVESDEGEGAESPEDEGVRETWEGPLADDFGLTNDFPEEVPHALTDGGDAEVRIFFGMKDAAENRGEAAEEDCGRGDDEGEKKELFPRLEGLGFSQRGGEEIHTRTHSRYTIRGVVRREGRDC